MDEVRQLIGLPVREWTVVPRSPLREGQRQQNGERSNTHMAEDGPQPERTQIEPETEPILVDKKTYVTKEGIVRTEYLWRHPPVFEDVHGRTTLVRVPAGLSDDWKQALLEARREGAAPKQWSRRNEPDERASETGTKGVDGTARGGSAHNTATSARDSPTDGVSGQRVPANVRGLEKPRHGDLAIRTIPRGGNMTQNGGGNPGLVRKDNLQNLKGVDKAKEAPAAQETTQKGEEKTPLRRETEEEARKVFLKGLKEGKNTNIGSKSSFR